MFSIVLVIKSIGLPLPLIYLTSIISFLLYNYYKAIILITNCFSLVVLSFTKYLYNEYKSIYIIILDSSSFNLSQIVDKVVLITILILTPTTIIYISDIRTNLITLFDLVEL